MDLTKANSIYKQIKKEIINLKYGVGDMINEKALADRYGVSKTPVREALTALVQDGFLVKYPRRGYFIKEINFKEFHELLQFRYLIENGIAQYIIEKCSDEKIESLYKYTPVISVSYEEFEKENRKFHLALANITDNKYMVNALQNVFDINVRQSAITGYNNVKNDVHMEHRDIVDALKKRDSELVSKMIKRDLQRSDEKDIML